jgi:hypothetical protein
MPTLSFKPASLSLEFVAGDDVPIALTFSSKDGSGAVTAMNLTGCQVAAVINTATAGQQATVSMAITTPLQGKVSGLLSAALTAPLNTSDKPIKRDWFVYVVDAAGHKRTYISGTATVLPRV